MNIDLTIEILTKEQKSKIADLLFEKYIKAISELEFSKEKISITDQVQREIESMFDNGDVYENIDFSKIGKSLTKKILDTIK